MAGVIPAVATAMGKQLPVAKTQENFVSVFGNLSYREENKAIIVGMLDEGPTSFRFTMNRRDSLKLVQSLVV